MAKKLSADHKLFHIHLHDTTKDSDRHWSPGQGEINFTPILNQLRQTGYKGIIEIEVSALNDALAGKNYLERLDNAS